MARGPLALHSRDMNAKRIAATILWFAAGWTLASMAVAVLGLSSAIAPAAGLIVAALVFVDPAGILWPPRPTTAHEAAERESLRA